MNLNRNSKYRQNLKRWNTRIKLRYDCLSLGRKLEVQKMANHPSVISIIERELNIKGKIMKIQFDRLEEKGGTSKKGRPYILVYVYGTAIGGKLDGLEWSTKFFKSNKAMLKKAKTLSKGDEVNVTMEQDGDFWNPTNIEPVEKDVFDAAIVSAKEASPKEASPLIRQSFTKADMVFEALPIVKQLMQNMGRGEATPEWIVDTCAETADGLIDYIEGKGKFAFNGSVDSIPTDDAIDDDDDDLDMKDIEID